MIKYILPLLLISILTLNSCGDDEQYDKEIGYEQAMLNYMEAQGWDGMGIIDGMYVVIDEPGDEEKPTASDLITAKYRGYYTDGEEFDSGDDFQFRLNTVIEGWSLGIPKFGRGGKGHLLIPPHLGYGENPSNSIRPNSVLIFDIEIKSF